MLQFSNKKCPTRGITEIIPNSFLEDKRVVSEVHNLAGGLRKMSNFI